MNFTCPSCGMENAYFEILDERGAHYTCPDCDYEWTDKDVTSNEEEEDSDDDNGDVDSDEEQ